MMAANGGKSVSFRFLLHIPLFVTTAALFGLAVCGCAAPASPPTSRTSPVVDLSGNPGTSNLKLTKATNPHEAMRWRRKTWTNEDGKIPEGALRQAVGQRLANMALAQPRGGARFAGIDSVNWVERGPRNVGGRSRSILIDAADPNRLIAGAVSGGIWKSTTGGASWTPINDEFPSLAICCLAIDPNNPLVIYAGTGEGFFNGDAIGGAGIYKSVDGGETWAQLASTSGWDNVCRIAVSPSNSNVILASKRYGGIYRSTNAGFSWQARLGAQGSFYVAFDPIDGSKAVGHVIDYDSDWYHRAVYSVNGGFTWTTAGGLNHVNGFGSRIELAYAPSQSSIVYASSAADGGKIWKSTDGGQSYAIQTAGQTTGVSWYTNPLWVDPTNPNFLVTGGYHLQRSTDGGVSFTQISDGYILTSQPHPDLHAIVSDPGFDGVTNRRVYICTDGGVFRTDNIYTASTAAGWTNLDGEYRATQFYGAAGDGGSGRIIGGTQDNGTLRLEPGSDLANLPFGGDGGFCAIDWSNPNYCYGEYITLQIHRSSDGGVSAGYIINGLADAGTAANFIAPFILDPNNPARLLAGGSRLWRCPNARANPIFITWQQIRPAGTDYISAIAVAPGNSNNIWVGQNNGEVHRTANGTAVSPTWSPIDDNSGVNPLPNRYITRILIDPDDHNTAYVCLGGFAADNLMKTVNGGANWTDATGAGATGLPNAPIRGIARHPRKPNWLYVGTEVGIFASEDGGATWSTTDKGPANVSVDEITFMHDTETLLAATHGRGIYTIAVPACLLLGDVNQDESLSADDIAGFVRAKLGAPLPEDESACADYEPGSLELDTAAFVDDLLNG